MGDTPDIEIYDNKILGKGAYGTVYLGIKKIKESNTSKASMAESNIKNTESNSTFTESKTTIADSKDQNSESKNEVANLKTEVIESEIKIALKEIPPEIDNDQDAKNSLSNEIIVSSCLDNTNIVRMIDIIYKKIKDI